MYMAKEWRKKREVPTTILRFMSRRGISCSHDEQQTSLRRDID
ncbi:hypothetical protein V6Z12_A10G067700 [Gossypium hirsutum]